MQPPLAEAPPARFQRLDEVLAWITEIRRRRWW
jgi:hypothetical protein